jgi:hypothetical protein
MGWVALWLATLGVLFVKSDWRGVFGGAPMDCTHAWENDHCCVCGEDR